MSGLESLITTKSEPDGVDLARAGVRWAGSFTSVAVGIASSASIPSTTAQFMLWNGESDGGKSYILEDVTSLVLTGTSAVGASILWALSTERIAKPSLVGGYTVTSFSCKTPIRGVTGSEVPGTKAIFSSNRTFPVDPDGWALYANVGSPAMTVGGGLSRETQGRIIIPPGYALGLNIFDSSSAMTWLLAPIWLELSLDLE